MAHYKWIQKAKENPRSKFDDDSDLNAWTNYGRRSVHIDTNALAKTIENKPSYGTDEDSETKRDYSGNYEDMMSKIYKNSVPSYRNPELTYHSSGISPHYGDGNSGESTLSSRSYKPFTPSYKSSYENSETNPQRWTPMTPDYKLSSFGKIEQDIANISNRRSDLENLYNSYDKSAPLPLDRQPSEFEVYKPKFVSSSVKSRQEPYVNVNEGRLKRDYLSISQMYPMSNNDFESYSPATGLSQPNRPSLATFRNATAQPPDRTITVDYRNTRHGNSMRYGRSDFIRPQDSAIHGANFMIISQRQPDSWFSKVDRLLAEARS